MMRAIVDLAAQTLGPVLYVLLLLGALLGLVVGIMLLVDSERVMRWNSALNRWYSTRQAMRTLDQPIDTKRGIYRWHRVTGVLVFAGSIYTLDALTFTYDARAVLYAFRDLGNRALLDLAFETLRIFLIVGNVAALLAGVVLIFRPSLLKGFESWGDREYNARVSTKALDAMRYEPDNFVRARPKTVGAVVAIASLYVLATLGFLLI